MSTPGFDYQELLVFYGLGPDDALHQGLQTVVAVYTCHQNGTHKRGTAARPPWVDPPDFAAFRQHVQELRGQLDTAPDQQGSFDDRLASIPEKKHLEKLKVALAAEIDRINDQLANLPDENSSGELPDQNSSGDG